MPLFGDCRCRFWAQSSNASWTNWNEFVVLEGSVIGLLHRHRDQRQPGCGDTLIYTTHRHRWSNCDYQREKVPFINFNFSSKFLFNDHPAGILHEKFPNRFGWVFLTANDPEWWKSRDVVVVLVWLGSFQKAYTQYNDLTLNVAINNTRFKLENNWTNSYEWMNKK
jgi:hypothetical protein